MIGTSNQLGAETAPQGAATPSPAESSVTADADYQSFLKLLTAQLRNQDPLAPLDSTQFVEQLASFSSVEQQIQTNNYLEQLTSSLVGSTLENATQWIGKEIEISSGAANYNGEPLTYRLPENDLGATEVEVVIKDRVGGVVYSERLSTGVDGFSWDGKTSGGETAPIGDYRISLNYISDGDVIGSKTPIAIAEVTEARLVDSSVKLVIDNGAITDPADVLAVRKAAEDDETGV